MIFCILHHKVKNNSYFISMIFPDDKMGNDIDNLKNQKPSTSVKTVLRSGVGHRSFLRLKLNCDNRILPFPAKWHPVYDD